MKKFHQFSLRVLVLLALVALLAAVDRKQQPAFDLLVLGSEGGLAESNLSSFLVGEKGAGWFVALDAGNLLSGLRAAREKGSLNGLVPKDSPYTAEGWMIKEGIKAYVLSHAHLDHIAGLVINSTDDSAKPIYALGSTIDYLRDNVFNWEVWPNFGDEGVEPCLGQYRYQRVPALESQQLVGTSMTLRSYPLCHSDCYPSTAFLLGAPRSAYLLYVGDTGPDEVEHSQNLDRLWSAVAPLVRAKELRAVMLECSYPNGRSPELLFGHLTPEWMLKELHRLEDKVGKGGLRGLKVVVFHIKPTLMKGPTTREQIMQQLKAGNDLGVEFLFPEQGDRLQF